MSLLLVLLIAHAFACISCATGEKAPICGPDDVMACAEMVTPHIGNADPLSTNLTTACKSLTVIAKIFTECLIKRISACETTRITRKVLETIPSFVTELCTYGNKIRKTAQKTIVCLKSIMGEFDTCQYTVSNKLTGTPAVDGMERFCCSLTEFSECYQAIVDQKCRNSAASSLVQRIMRWAKQIIRVYCEFRANGTKRNCDQYRVDTVNHIKRPHVLLY